MMALLMTSDNKWYSEETYFVNFIMAKINDEIRKRLQAFGFITEKYIYECLGFDSEDITDKIYYYQEEITDIKLCVTDIRVYDRGLLSKAYLIEVRFEREGS